MVLKTFLERSVGLFFRANMGFRCENIVIRQLLLCGTLVFIGFL